MCRRRLTRPARGSELVVALLLTLPAITAATVAVASSAAAAELSPEELLAASDVRRAAPESFRARMRLTVRQTAGGPAATSDLEVWRQGDQHALVRFLDPKERGKFLLRLGGDLWFLAPAARPVRLSPAYRLRGGASLEDILGIDVARDYRVEVSAREQGPRGELVALQLAAKAKDAPYPRLRWVVDPAQRRPVRAEYLLASGKVFRRVEFEAWQEGHLLWPRRLVIREPLRPGAETTVELLSIEPRPAPAGLFDLHDSAARDALPPPAP
jgi:Outer membrane lipoprotein-sorting protein